MPRRFTQLEEKVEKQIVKKQKRISAYRKEVSRKAAIANKRIKRLEEKGMTSSPAYQKWLSDGGQKFSVRGKSYNEVQSELAKINTYLDSATSSISGSKKVIKQMMDNIGVKDKDFKKKNFEQVQKETKKFFEIASQIEQYMRTVEDRASSLGYQKIWEAINKYTRDVDKNILNSERDVSSISSDIIKAMKEIEKSDVNEKIRGENYSYSVWAELSKD